MSNNSLRETARAMLESMRKSPPEAIAEEVKDTYPDITLEDATRIKDGLLSMITARTKEEYSRLERDYKALHAELKKKYRKSGKQ